MGGVKQIVDRSKEMLKATLDVDAGRVAVMLEEVLLVGVSYDKKMKKHTCVIERLTLV